MLNNLTRHELLGLLPEVRALGGETQQRPAVADDYYSPARHAARLKAFRTQADALMRDGLLKLLNGQSQAVVTLQQFKSGMPPAFPATTMPVAGR